MCGIIGYVGPKGIDVTTLLLDGLAKLEYRGYDSAGIAVLTTEGELELHRRAGKIANLVATVESEARQIRIGARTGGQREGVVRAGRALENQTRTALVGDDRGAHAASDRANRAHADARQPPLDLRLSYRRVLRFELFAQ